MKQRFEHKCVMAKYGTEIDQILSTYELDGWELVSTTFVDPGFFYLFFKRPS
jgi:hypothetical protein